MKVYLHANCQGLLLSGLLAEAMPSWSIKSRQVHVEADFKDFGEYLNDLKQADIVIAQPINDDYGPNGTRSLKFVLANMKASATVVTFPSLFFNSQLPEWFYLTTEIGRLQSVGMAYHNVLVFAAALRSQPFDEMMRDITRPDFFSASFLEAELQAATQAICRREKEHNVTIVASDLFHDLYSSFEVMNAINHPRRAIGCRIAERILKHLGLPSSLKQEGIEYLPVPRLPTSNSVASRLFPDRYKHNTTVVIKKRSLDLAAYYREVFAYYQSLPRPEIASVLKNSPEARQFLERLDYQPTPPIPGETTSGRVAGTAVVQDADADRILEAARGLRAEGRLEAAIELLAGATAASKSDSRLFRELGQCLRGSKQFDKAARAFQAVVALQPNDAVAHEDFGRVALLSGDRDQAEDALLEALRINPRRRGAWLALGTLYHREKKLDTAQHYLETYLNLAPEDIEARHRLARICAERGDHDNALAHFAELVSHKDAPPTARLEMARSLRAAGRTEDAIGELERIVADDPHHSRAWQELGDTLCFAQRFAEARHAFLRAKTAALAS